MAERIRGLSIDLDLDDTGVIRSIGSIKRSFRDLNSSLKTNMNNFKYSEKSIDSYEQAIGDLGKTINGQKKNVSGLKSKMDELTQAGKSHTAEASKIRQEYNRQVDHLNMLERQLENTSNEFKQFTKEQQIASSKWTLMGNQLDAMSEKLTSVGDRMRGVGQNLTMGLTVPLAGIGVGALKAAGEYEAAGSQFSQVFGKLEGQAQTSLDEIAQKTGLLPNALRGSFTQMAAFAKTTGADTKEAMDLTARATMAAADSAAFYDKSIEDTTEALQSYLKGNYENDSALGISSTETTRNAAANKLYGKSFKELSEQQKQLTLLQMVEDGNKLSGALGQASRESDTLATQTVNVKIAFQDFLAELGKPILPKAVDILKAMSGAVKGASTWFSGLSDGAQTATLGFGGFAMALGPVITGVGIFASSLGSIFKFLSPLSKGIAEAGGAAKFLSGKLGFLKIIFATMTGPIGLTVAAIAGLGIGFTVAYKKSETFRNIVNKAMDGVRIAFQRVKDIASGFFKLFQGNGTEGVISLSKILPPSVVVGLSRFADVLKNVFTTMKTNVQTAVKVVGSSFNYVRKVVTGVIQLFQGNGTDGVITLSKLLPPGLVVGLTQFADGVKSNFFAVINAIKSFAQQIGKTLSTFWQQNGGMIKEALGNIFGFVKTVFLGIFNFVKPIVQALGTAIKFVFQNVIVPVITAGMKAIWAIMKFIWPGVKLLVVSTWENIKNIIKAALNIVMGIIKVFAGLFTGNWKKMWEGIKQIFKGALTIVWNLVQLYFIGKIMKVAKLFVGLFKNVFKSGLGIIKKTFTTILNAIWRFIKVIFGKILGVFKLSIKGWKNIFSTGWNFIRNTFKKVTSSIYNFVRNIFVKLRNNLKITMYNLRKMFASIWLSIKKNTTGNVSRMWTSIKNTFTKLWSGTKLIMTKVKNSMSSIWRSIKSNTVNMASGLWKSVRNTFNKMKSGLKGIIDKIKSHISGMTGAVKKGINALLRGVNKVGGKLGMSNIPYLSTGTDNNRKRFIKNGRISEGTMAVVGDKGKGNGSGGFRNEIIEYPNGKRVMTPNTDTTTFLPKGSKVYSGKQTQQMLPKFNLGTDIWKGVSGAGDWAKSKALDTGVKVAKTTKDVMKGLGDVMDYATDPGKLFSKIMSLVGFDGFKGMKGGFIGDFARGIFGKMKKAIIGMFKNGFDSMMADEGGDGGFLDMSKLSYRYGHTKEYTAETGVQWHDGVDFGYIYEPLYSTVGGKATVPAYMPGGYGNWVKIISGALEVIYGHMKSISIKNGQMVKPGTKLGISGNTGFSTGPHLHYEMRKNGKSFDPVPWLKKNNGSSGKNISAGVGANAKSWIPMIRKAAAQMKVSISGNDVNAIVAQIHRESGGNQNIVQSSAVWDVNTASGNPAQGLLQYIPQTFRAFAVKGHGNIRSGYDQLLAFFNNSNWRRDNPGGTSGWGPSGSRRFATGGLINNAGWYNIAEGGYPEWIIPTDPKRKSEAMSMIAMAANQIQGNRTAGNKRPNQLGTVGGNDEAIMQMLQHQQQQIALLSQLVASNQVIANKDFQPTINKRDFQHQVDEAVKVNNRKSNRHAQFKTATI